MTAPRGRGGKKRVLTLDQYQSAIRNDYLQGCVSVKSYVPYQSEQIYNEQKHEQKQIYNFKYLLPK